jgi:DNA-binding response OmpR family regulator
MHRLEFHPRLLGKDTHPPSKKVLIAEEDDELRTSLVLELSKDGYNIIEVEDGLELRDYLEAVQLPRSPLDWPAVIISDVELSGCGGVEVCEWLHALDKFLPFILLTWRNEPKARAAAERAGAWYIFEKPLRVHELRNAVSFLAGL